MNTIEITAEAEAYTRLGSVHRAAVELGVSHSTVHRRLQKSGVMLKGSMFTEVERAAVRSYYTATPDAEFDLKKLAALLGRRHTGLSRLANEMGLSRIGRSRRPDTTAKSAAGLSKRWIEQGHPRGMAGKTISDGARATIGAKSKANWEIWRATGTGAMSEACRNAASDRGLKNGAALLSKGEAMYSRCASGRRDDLGANFWRSRWEANYARYLNWLVKAGQIEKWEYEPTTFWFEAIRRGVRSYKPDFLITEGGRTYFVEVKGWMDPKSKTKLKRMKKYHPTVEVRVVAQREYREIERKVGALIPGWETAKTKTATIPVVSIISQPAAASEARGRGRGSQRAPSPRTQSPVRPESGR